MSSINPNNIDGQYPIAGQDNDSQGFRDNFTNIKNNFQFAYDELADLQSKVVLKSALSGGSLSNDMSYAQLIKPQLLNVVEAQNPISGSVSGNVNLSWLDGDFQKFTTGGDVVLGITNWPQNGTYAKLRLQITTGASVANITFPSGTTSNVVGVSNLQGFVSGQQIRLLGSSLYQFELASSSNGNPITVQDLLRNYDAAIDFTTVDTTNVNATGNVQSTGLTVFGNTSVGIVGKISGSWHTIVGNITQTTSGGTVGYTTSGYVAVTGNVIGGLGQFAAINSTPIGNASASTGAFTTLTSTSVNSSGNILGTGGVLSSLTVNGNVIINDPVTGSNSSSLSIKGSYQYKYWDYSNVTSSSDSITLAPGGDQLKLVQINGNLAVGYNSPIVAGSKVEYTVQNISASNVWVNLPNTNTNTGKGNVFVLHNSYVRFVFTAFGANTAMVAVAHDGLA